MNNEFIPNMRTIRQEASTGTLPEHALRMMLKRDQLPGIYIGSRFYVNHDALIAQLSGKQ